MLKEFQLKPRAWLYLVKKPGGQVINLTLPNDLPSIIE